MYLYEILKVYVVMLLCVCSDKRLFLYVSLKCACEDLPHQRITYRLSKKDSIVTLFLSTARVTLCILVNIYVVTIINSTITIYKHFAVTFDLINDVTLSCSAIRECKINNS